MFIVDSSGKIVAEIHVEQVNGAQHHGTVVSKNFSSALADALSEYAEVIEQQVFSLLDEAEARVAAFGLGAKGDNGWRISTY